MSNAKESLRKDKKPGHWHSRVLTLIGSRYRRNLFTGFGDTVGRPTSHWRAIPEKSFNVSEAEAIAMMRAWDSDYGTRTLTRYDWLLGEFPDVDVTKLVPGKEYRYWSLYWLEHHPASYEIYANRKIRRNASMQRAGLSGPKKLSDLPANVSQRIRVRDNDCWIWTGAMTASGYGTTRWKGRSIAAHRLVYSLLVGPIQAGAILLHECDIRQCVAPHHLASGSINHNMDDIKKRGRHRNIAYATRWAVGKGPIGRIGHEQRAYIRKQFASCPSKATAKKLATQFSVSLLAIGFLAYPTVSLAEMRDIRLAFLLGGRSARSLAREYGISAGVARDIILYREPSGYWAS